MELKLQVKVSEALMLGNTDRVTLLSAIKHLSEEVVAINQFGGGRSNTKKGSSA